MTEYDVRVAGFAELDALTAYRLWQLRESVFVVEQECAYQELDGRDVEPGTRHLWVEGEPPAHGPVGYLRLLDDGDHARIGRVLVAPSHRGRGVSAALMRAALDVIGDRPSVLSAQTPLAGWYASFGYVPDGDPFVEDGIPHTPMRRQPVYGSRSAETLQGVGGVVDEDQGVGTREGEPEQRSGPSR